MPQSLSRLILVIILLTLVLLLVVLLPVLLANSVMRVQLFVPTVYPVDTQRHLQPHAVIVLKVTLLHLEQAFVLLPLLENISLV